MAVSRLHESKPRIWSGTFTPVHSVLLDIISHILFNHLFLVIDAKKPLYHKEGSYFNLLYGEVPGTKMVCNYLPHGDK